VSNIVSAGRDEGWFCVTKRWFMGTARADAGGGQCNAAFDGYGEANGQAASGSYR